jgi:hypothetical protein
VFSMPDTGKNNCAHVYNLPLIRWCLSLSAGPPLEPPCAVGAVGTKQARGLNA